MGRAKAKRELLRGPLLKVERAREHVENLDRRVGEYLAHHPFRLRVRERKNPPHRLVYVGADLGIPDDLALIAGDVVHNLGTALDHLCFAMVGDKAPKPSSIGFPFAKTKDALAGMINARQMHVATNAVIQEIQDLEPYPEGNKYLHAVHAMDVRDKHHFILTVGLGVEFTLLQLGHLVGRDRVAHLGPPETRLAAVGDFSVDLTDNPPVEEFDKDADIQPDFTVGFGDGETLVGSPAIPALQEMVVATENALHRLARAHLQ